MFKKLFVFVFKLIILLGIFIAAFVGLVYIGGFGPLPSKQELTKIKQSQASIVYSEDSKIIGKFFTTNRTNVTFEKLPKHLIDALVATEDSRFYNHKGIDNISLLRVLVKTIILGDRSSGGGSTLSQQLAKNLFKRKDFAILSMPVNKTKEAILAYRLESIYTKEDILTLYFNTVPFGENVYGIESASQRFYSKSANQLTLDESAVLVGLLKANSYYNPNRNPDHALQRRNVVLQQMLKAAFITKEQYYTASRKELSVNYYNLVSKNPNGYFLNTVKQEAQNILKNYTKDDGAEWSIENDGLVIKTTLNYQLQKSALEARKQHLAKLQKAMDSYWAILKNQPRIKKIVNNEWIKSKDYLRLKNKGYNNSEIHLKVKEPQSRLLFDWDDNRVKNISKIDSIAYYIKMIHAAVYGVHTKTGAVKIYVGGNNYQFLPYNLINSERQVASTFKPIVFTAALENGQKPCDWIDNEVKTYEQYVNWTPQNYDLSNGGYYSMMGALTKSMNVPTVKTYFEVGHQKLEATAHKLGLNQSLKDKPSVALGVTNYSLQQMVHAYVPFANRGHRVTPYYITSITDQKGNIIYQHKKAAIKRVDISSKNLETMQYLLKNVVDNGTAVKLKTKYKARGDWAGKTGTSQDYSDSWFIGFNANIAIGTWVGCKYPSVHLPSRIGGGSVAALPIVGEIISKSYAYKTNQLLSTGFPAFNNKVIEDCDCELYREENTIEKIFDVFDEDSLTQKNTSTPKDKPKKKRSFFKWLFGKKD
ncbi:transglycosylase domain-containing protein [Wenyingzhuangia sp. IMCC45533]